MHFFSLNYFLNANTFFLWFEKAFVNILTKASIFWLKQHFFWDSLIKKQKKAVRIWVCAVVSQAPPAGRNKRSSSSLTSRSVSSSQLPTECPEDGPLTSKSLTSKTSLDFSRETSLWAAAAVLQTMTFAAVTTPCVSAGRSQRLEVARACLWPGRTIFAALEVKCVVPSSDGCLYVCSKALEEHGRIRMERFKTTWPQRRGP